MKSELDCFFSVLNICSSILRGSICRNDEGGSWVIVPIQNIAQNNMIYSWIFYCFAMCTSFQCLLCADCKYTNKYFEKIICFRNSWSQLKALWTQKTEYKLLFQTSKFNIFYCAILSGFFGLFCFRKVDLKSGDIFTVEILQIWCFQRMMSFSFGL